ncbi:MAG: hypothetical protein ACXW2C_08265 [Acidimicrobiia bacterium]
MSIVTVSVIAVGSAIVGFLTAAMLSAAKGSDHLPTRERAAEPGIVSGPSQN